MKKRVLRNIITWIVIFLVLFIAFYLILSRNKDKPQTSEEIAKCIGENAVLYVQLGCHACETQERMFGNNTKYLNIVDCFEQREKCSSIKYTPTWIINNQKYTGVQSIEKLKLLTNC